MAKVDNTASGRGTLMKCMMDTKRVPTMVTKTRINKVLFMVICLGAMKTTMTSLVTWVGMVGMMGTMDSTAGLEDMKGMATGGMMTTVEGMMATTIMERLAVMVAMVDTADTAITKVLFE